MRTVWNPFTSTSNRKLFIAAIFSFGLVILLSGRIYAASTVTFSLPERLEAGSEFEIRFTVDGANPSTAYYAKIAAYHESDPTYLYYGYTKSGDGQWLTYNDSWSKFPSFDSNTEGTISGKLVAKIRSDKEFGVIGIKIRLAKTDKTSSQINSEAKTFTVTAPQPPEITKTETSDTAPQVNSNPAEQTAGTGTDNQTDQPSDLIVPIKPIQPTNINIKLPATFSAQEVPRVLSDATISASPSSDQAASSLTTPKHNQPNKYVIILGSLSLLGAVIAGIVVFIKSRGFLK